MNLLKSLLTVSGLFALVSLGATPSSAEPTRYPLTIENCGTQVTFRKAPARVIGLGQNSAEILLLLGLQDRMVGTAFWPSAVLPQLAEANAKVKLLTVEFPTFESILAEDPDFVAAALPSLLGPNSKVAKRGDFDKVGVPTYLSPSTCLDTQGAKDVYGSRAQLWSIDLLYKEIDELSRIFDVADRGQALIADFKAREMALRAVVPKADRKLSYVFWFSSPSPAADAFLGGKNGASGFIVDLLGGTNAITTEAEWPTLGWEGIMAANPDVIVVASLDRNRWELDKSEAKIKFLTTDPAVSQMPAVKNKAMVVMDGQAMNPTVRTLYGAEQVAGQLKTLGLVK
ncbi:ABC transporter substrate-binding protein (plasmid) [Skermanella rosea]|uniref:ABC transporter substrate-binding protein n=1 Tax=Skermanella rosea TaxID=1817965 RepID=UPI0019315606|nr:ABC transporter substrate-binding protein [Skermanella rosea]UEM07507.1 ABC transporter substrate-binding protein [Skermanella rosea]